MKIMPPAPQRTPILSRVSIRPERLRDVVDRILNRMEDGEVVSLTETQLRSVAAGETQPSTLFVAEAVLASPGLRAADLFDIRMVDDA